MVRIYVNETITLELHAFFFCIYKQQGIMSKIIANMADFGQAVDVLLIKKWYIMFIDI